MKRWLVTVGILLGIGVLGAGVWSQTAHATDIRSGETVTVTHSDVIDSTLYATGQTLTVDGTVQGDVFCAGMHVVISGTVEGDVICAGQSVLVSGTVRGDVRLAAAQVDISGTIEGSATIFAQSLVTSAESHIGSDMTFYAATAHVNGQVHRDVLARAESMVVSGTIDRDIDASVGSLTLSSSAQIGRDLMYHSETAGSISDSATVAGAVQYVQKETREGYGIAERFGNAVYGFAATLLIGLAAIAVAPRAYDAVTSPMRRRPFVTFAVGAAVLVGVPILGLMFLISIFGLPLGLVILMIWGAGVVSALAVASYTLGWVIVQKMNWPPRGRRLLSLLIGLALLTLASLIPIIGGPIIFLAVVCGLGALSMAIGQRVILPQRVAKNSKGSKK